VTKLVTVAALLLTVVLIGGGVALGLARARQDYAAPLVAPVPKNDVPPKTPTVPKSMTDQELLRGHWKVEMASTKGIKEQVWVFTGDKITIKFQNGAKEGKPRAHEIFSYRLDTTKRPREIELVPTAALLDGGQGETLPGIYELAGDSLKLCYRDGKLRPTSFERDPAFARDRGRRLFVLRRDPAGEFKDIAKEYDEGEQNVFRRDKYEKRALELAQQHPKEQFAVDALLWILRRGWRGDMLLLATSQPFGPSSGKALKLLAKDYAADKRAGDAKIVFALAPPEADQFLQAVMEKNPDRQAQARACFILAERGKWLAEQARFNSTIERPADNDEERRTSNR
jgi:uncharacterized protein (TIGR03067 family)